MNDFKFKEQFEAQEEVITLTWASFTPATNVAPDTDIKINIDLATSISIQIDTMASGNASDDIDINVHSTLLGGPWDSVPFAERNIGDAEVKTFLIEPGPKMIRLRADNNHGSAAAVIKVLILVRSLNAP
ncbi:hypothetical protein LCGC14_0867570 [marine sediment metagenome]|uniref:Uncharacterized protein n=1 Tax=marine sediment metagenome TaxID=412755 RepID=A0A0F9PAH2_9ZZZZ|nr:hypothetical protein [Desulfobacterales bacterium]